VNFLTEYYQPHSNAVAKDISWQTNKLELKEQARIAGITDRNKKWTH
jgi:hypothetical protein